MLLIGFVLFTAATLLQAHAEDCLEYDTDYYGTNINNGFEQLTDNPEDCQKLCAFTSGCEGFTWASGNFFGPYSQ